MTIFNLGLNRNTKLILYSLGIFVCYFYYGIIQEKITRGTYGEGDEKEKFTFALSLVFVQCVVNYGFANILLATIMKNQGEDHTRTIYYACSALTYLLAMVCSNMALQWVNYPTQVVGKSGKPIPVMVLGVLLGRKTYPPRKYLFVLLIVIGVAAFMYKDSAAKSSQSEGGGLGEVLLLLSLTMDGLTAAAQERMAAEHGTKSGHMMRGMNLWSTMFLSVAVLLTGDGLAALQFCQRHPAAASHLATLALSSALGQLFIFLTVTEFGPLACSVATTTRKFFTVLASVLFFGNRLVWPRQWLAAILVFTGLTLDAMYGKSPAPRKT
ncbi:solute carrier family 35 member B1 homolog [Schistocerca cancellata]|uniref:solute carrier family 35 member B1 homolog n=1 Tax=Schistocerca cancellata TaxID=274614 RepID=UPI00211860E7|nr:solute carrier family 35 member B1 homolog [Schistocerca cancellata]